MDAIILDMDRASEELEREIFFQLPMPGVWGIKLGNKVLERGLRNALPAAGSKIRTFVDLKHSDTRDRMQSIISLYERERARIPHFLSVSGEVSPATLKFIRAQDNGMTIVMVPLRSDQTDEECKREYGYADFELLLKRLVKAEFVGISAVTCPAQFLRYMEGMRIRRAFRTIVATGVRSTGVAQNEHVRPLPPEEALRMGATHVVVGREVILAPNPLRALCDLAGRCASVSQQA